MNQQAKHIAYQRQRIEKMLLPDTCQLVPALGATPVISGAGILVTEAPTPRLYRGLADIPCRADISRAFRPDKLKTQTTEVNEFNLELPSEVTVIATDRVVIRGRNFVIRKIKDVSNWDVTIECVIEEISTQIDNNEAY